MTRGDAEEFTEFVLATAPRLHRAALLLTGDHHLTDDLTQATYARVYASWRRVSRADDPLAYARRTLLNTYLSHRRLRRNSELPADPTLMPPPMVEHPRREGDHATRLDLLEALAALPPHDRAVLVLRYWEDRSVADTAHDLGISEGAVRTRSLRALQRLRPLLGADFIERTPS